MYGRCYRSPLDAHKPWLLELIGAEPDLTLEEIRGRLRQRRIKVSASSVWRFCDRHDITFKLRKSVALLNAASRRNKRLFSILLGTSRLKVNRPMQHR